MRLVEIFHRPGATEVSQLVDFVERTADATGERGLSDHLWLDLNAGGTAGFIAVRASDDTGTIALAQISGANETSSLEIVVTPTVADGTAVRIDLAMTAIDEFRARGGGALAWWLDDPGDTDVATAARFGLAPTRRIHEMRVALPIGRRAAIATRAFVPGADDDAWLAVNNRAFSMHDEQGGWTADTLGLRMQEPWFDPEGFRLHEIDGRLAGFCWTKLHADARPPMGEIYVVAVDPDFHGRGLGTEMTLAGLDAIGDHGLTAGGLWVDADNGPAIAVYEGLGFTVRRTRTAFVGRLTPATGPAA